MFRALQRLKEDTVETFILIKVCFTSFWFWLPTLYATYIIFQIWMLIAVHPLTILILPSALAVYAVTREEKTIKAQYGIKEQKPGSVPSPFTLLPQDSKGFRWDLEKALDEYKKITEEDDEN